MEEKDKQKKLNEYIDALDDSVTELLKGILQQKRSSDKIDLVVRKIKQQLSLKWLGEDNG